jgi:hypothetical protein
MLLRLQKLANGLWEDLRVPVMVVRQVDDTGLKQQVQAKGLKQPMKATGLKQPVQTKGLKLSGATQNDRSVTIVLHWSFILASISYALLRYSTCMCVLSQHSTCIGTLQEIVSKKQQVKATGMKQH